MNEIKLTNHTTIPDIDRSLHNTILAFETAFANQILGYYLLGSYVEQTAVPLSDIDLLLVFTDDFANAEEQARFQGLRQDCTRRSPVRLDIVSCTVSGVAELHPVLRTALRYGSLLLYGEDIRASVPLPPMSDYSTALITGAESFMRILRGGKPLTVPLDYPDVHDPFFGYTQKHISDWYPTGTRSGTKELVATVCRIAAAIVACETHRYVPGKQAAVNLLRDTGHIWSPFVHEIYQSCKIEWKYRVPRSSRERQALVRLCTQMLAFENMFLENYGSAA